MRIRVFALREQYQDKHDGGITIRLRYVVAEVEIIHQADVLTQNIRPLGFYFVIGSDLPEDTKLGDEFEVALTRISP